MTYQNRMNAQSRTQIQGTYYPRQTILTKRFLSYPEAPSTSEDLE